jgi:hypothetical protein
VPTGLGKGRAPRPSPEPPPGGLVGSLDRLLRTQSAQIERKKEREGEHTWRELILLRLFPPRFYGGAKSFRGAQSRILLLPLGFPFFFPFTAKRRKITPGQKWSCMAAVGGSPPPPLRLSKCFRVRQNPKARLFLSDGRFSGKAPRKVT